jgi:hypothetical protein
MRRLYSHIGLFLILLVSSSSYASKPYLEDNRIAYISKVIQAFSETSIHNIYNTYSYINVVERNNCRSSSSDLGTQCLLSYAKKNCIEAGSAALSETCELYSDVIVVNKMSENIFINRSERYRMLKNTDDDFRTVMATRLQQKYARIVTQFSLTEASECDEDDFECLAERLDQFCLDYTNTQSLSWQHCMSASLWFIGTSKRN